MWSAMALSKALGGCEWEYEFLCFVCVGCLKSSFLGGFGEDGGRLKVESGGSQRSWGEETGVSLPSSLNFLHLPHVTINTIWLRWGRTFFVPFFVHIFI